MESLLSKDRENTGEILRHAAKLAERYLRQRQNSAAPGMVVPDLEVRDLPQEGIGATATLEFFETKFADQIASSAGPRYFGFVTGGSTPASIAGDWLVSTYDQNACGSNDSIAPQIEKQTI